LYLNNSSAVAAEMCILSGETLQHKLPKDE
jgi:hypothetical protein